MEHHQCLSRQEQAAGQAEAEYKEFIAVAKHVTKRMLLDNLPMLTRSRIAQKNFVPVHILQKGKFNH